MAVYVKREDGEWDEAENLLPNLKVKDSTGWKDVYVAYVKTPSGWQVVWENAVPAPVITGSSTAAFAPNTSSVTITWEQPVIYNFLRYEFTTDGGATWGEASTNASLRSKVWNGLTERTSYTVGVRAVSKSLSTGQAFTTLTTANSTPSAPVALATESITPTSARIKWNASVSPDLAGGGTSYAINNSNDTVRVADTDNTYLDITGLSQNSSYTYKVYAKDSNGLFSSATSISFTTTNAAPPAATVTAWSTGDTGTSYTDTASVLKYAQWRIQYSGEAVSAVAYLFNSSNTYLNVSSTLYDSNNRQTSIDTYVTWNLSPSTEYRVAVDVTDANGATTRSSYVALTTPAYYTYQITGGVNVYTSSASPYDSMSASTSAGAGYGSSEVHDDKWWLSGANSSSTSGTAYEYIQWDMSWADDTLAANSQVSWRNYLIGNYDYYTTVDARWINGYYYAAADDNNTTYETGVTTTGNFKIYFSIYNGSGWRNDGGTNNGYTGSNGYNIPYTSDRDLGNDGYIDADFASDYRSEPTKVRWTVTRLQTHLNFSGYRASCYYLGVDYKYAVPYQTYYYR